MRIGVLLFFLSFCLQSSLQARMIEFRHEISSDHSVEVLWQELAQAMNDSEGSWLWPSSSSVSGEGLNHNGFIEVTYQFGLGNPTYRYRLSVDTSRYVFSYLAEDRDHPFTGGATITLIPNGEGSLLIWDGLYDAEGSSFISRLVFRQFEKSFFRELRKNLK